MLRHLTYFLSLFILCSLLLFFSKLCYVGCSSYHCSSLLLSYMFTLCLDYCSSLKKNLNCSLLDLLFYFFFLYCPVCSSDECSSVLGILLFFYLFYSYLLLFQLFFIKHFPCSYSVLVHFLFLPLFSFLYIYFCSVTAVLQ